MIKKRRDRFNYFACFIDVVGFSLGISLFSPITILPLFVKQITQKSIWIGVVAAINNGGFFILQIFAASWIQRLPIKRIYVLVVALIERAALLAIIISAIIFGKSAPNLLLALFLIFFAISTLCMSCNGPAYFDLVAKAVPPTKRGKMYGFAGGIGGLLSLLGAWLAKWFLESFEFPINFALCFSVGFAIMTVTVFPLGFIDEPRSKISEKKTFSQHFRGAGKFLKSDHNFRKFIYSQIFLSAYGAAVGFLTAFAIDDFAATKSDVALFTAIMMFGRTIGEPFWGHFADRHGNGRTLVINLSIGVTVIGATIFANSIWWFYAIFAMIIFCRSGLTIQSFNIAMEFANDDNLPTIVALRSTIIAPFRTLLPIFGGMLIDKIGYRAIFGIAFLMLFLSLIFMRSVSDPRFGSKKTKELQK